MRDFGQSLLALWKQLGVNQRVSLGVAALAVIGAITGLVLWSQRPDYQLLYARLGEKDSAAVISALQTQGIPHQILAGGAAVQVPANLVYKIRMDLAGKGIPSGDGVGFEIFDKGQFGLSDFVQRTNYIRAVQGELARTITQLHGVRAARVMIVQPENRLLLTEQGVKATASVFVDVGGTRLDLDQVNAIRHLVANAVQGLAADNVAVVDNNGRTLSEELKQDPTLGTATSQIRYRQQVEDYFARKVETMLATVIGPGHAVVRVSAEIETDAMTSTSEKFDPESQVIRSQTDTDDKTNTTEARTTGGAAGVSANVPDKAAANPADATRPTSTSEQNRKNKTITYEISRTTTNVTRAPGAVRNLTAAVFISPRPALPAATAAAAPGQAAPSPVAAPRRTEAELDALRQVVVNALGLKLAPGQPLTAVVSLQELEFLPATTAVAAETIPANETNVQRWIAGASRWFAVAIAVAILVVFALLLKRQKPEPVPIEVLSLTPEMAAQRLPHASNVTPELLNELIRQKPANISMTLRDWVSAGSSPPSKN